MKTVIKLTVLLVIGSLLPAISNACTSCLCGDPTLTTLGTEKPYAGRMQFGYEVLHREETTGQAGIDQKVIHETRHTINGSYWLSKSFAFNVALPLHSTLKMDVVNGADQQGSGLGDIDLNARFYHKQNRKMNTGWITGLRIPSGKQQRTNDGRAIDIDAQPGQGVWGVRLGGWYSRYQYPWSFHASSILHTPTNEGFQGFKPGEQLTYNANGQYALNYKVSVSLGYEGRSGRKDRFFGQRDNNSGGTIGYLAASLIGKWHVSGLWHLKAQYAVLDHLKGFREEPFVIYAGVGYGF